MFRSIITYHLHPIIDAKRIEEFDKQYPLQELKKILVNSKDFGGC